MDRFYKHCNDLKLDQALIILQQNPSIINDFFKGATLLHRICHSSEFYGPIVDEVLKYPDLDVNIINNHGNTPLMIALNYGRIGLVRELLKRGADPNYVSNHTTALHYAVINNTRTMLQLLIDFGADLTLVNKKGRTPIEHLRHCISNVPLGDDWEGHGIKWMDNLAFLNGLDVMEIKDPDNN